MSGEELAVMAQELDDLRQTCCGLRLMIEALEKRVGRLEGPLVVVVPGDDAGDCASYTELMLSDP